MKLDDETAWNLRAIDIGQDFAATCRNLCDENPGKHDNPLLHILNGTMTELWDHGFSQAEIRQAFLDAVDDLPRYATGEERRN